MSERHIPVLGPQAVGMLDVKDGGIYVDATFGAGGYTRLMLDAANCKVIGIDRDRNAIAGGFDLVDQSDGRLLLVEGRFSELDEIVTAQGYAQVDGIVMDIGVSSMQLDEAARGFSFRLDGPLDMRMSGQGPTVADVVAKAEESDLADIIYQLGEERHSRRIARAIVSARVEMPIRSTRQLADIVSRVVRSRPGDIHPATRTFQALRIFVNEELDELNAALAAAERILKTGGRLAVVSFHSLEDRIVKTFLSERSETRGGSRHKPEVARVAPSFTLVNKRAAVADEAEIAANPRARSAKLRGAIRTEHPPHDEAPPRRSLPSLAAVTGGA